MTTAEKIATDLTDQAMAEQEGQAKILKDRAAIIDTMTQLQIVESLGKHGMDWFDPALGLLKTETLARLFIVCDKARKHFEKNAEASKDNATKVDSALRPRMQDGGIKSMNVDGTTVYVERTLWGSAKDGNNPGLCLALKELGHGDMVKEGVNAQTFSAYIREQEEAVSKTPLAPEKLIEQLPELLRPVVHVSEVFKIRARKG